MVIWALTSMQGNITQPSKTLLTQNLIITWQKAVTALDQKFIIQNFLNNITVTQRGEHWGQQVEWVYLTINGGCLWRTR